MKKNTGLFVLFIILSFLSNSQEPIIIDHTSTVLSDIPERWIDSAKQNLHIGYGHTSHGSQLATGMNALESFFTDGTYDWSNYDNSGELHLFEGNMWSHDGYLGLDIGAIGWDDETRDYLDDHPGCNVIIWAWCGLENTVLDRDVLNHYLLPMNQLEEEYPEVDFVYMTGPLDGRGPEGLVKQANDSIRQFCQENNKILYDFADIEKYDPDWETNYQNYYVDDECDYDPDGQEPIDLTENWAENWVAQNPSDSLTSLTNEAVSDDCNLGHTHCLNCVLKGIAAWNLWAQIAGWEPSPEVPSDTTSFTTSEGIWNEQNNWDYGIPDSTQTAIILENHTVSIENNAQCSTLIVKPGASIIIQEGDTLTTNKILMEADTSTSKAINHGWIDAEDGVYIQQYIPANTWTPVSPPVENDLSGAFNAKDGEFYSWNPTSSGYYQISDNFTQLPPMKGFLYRNNRNDTIIEHHGIINQGDQEFALSINSTDTLPGHWNLTGNPYPAPINWNHPSWEKDYIAKSLYLHPEKGHPPCTYVNGVSNPEGCFDGIIKSMQAFWVYAQSEGSLVVKDNAQTNNSSKPLLRKIKQKALRLKIQKDTTVYETTILFDDAATQNFDQELDAYHFNIPSIQNSYAPGLYSITDEFDQLSINSYPDTNSFSLPLGFTLLHSGTYAIELIEASEINQPLYILDKEKNQYINITDNPYSFIDSRGIHTKRFILTTEKPDNSTDISSIKDQFTVSGGKQSISIWHKQPVEARIQIFNLMGIKIYDSFITINEHTRIPMEQTGLFVTIIETPTSKTVEKVIVY